MFLEARSSDNSVSVLLVIRAPFRNDLEHRDNSLHMFYIYLEIINNNNYTYKYTKDVFLELYTVKIGYMRSKSLIIYVIVVIRMLCMRTGKKDRETLQGYALRKKRESKEGTDNINKNIFYTSLRRIVCRCCHFLMGKYCYAYIYQVLYEM